MKNIIIVLISFILISCGIPVPSERPHKHLVIVPRSTVTEYYYVTSEIKVEGSCITFKGWSDIDFDHQVVTVCGTYTIKY